MGGQIPFDDFAALSGSLDFFDFGGEVKGELFEASDPVNLEILQAAKRTGAVVQVGAGGGEFELQVHNPLVEGFKP